MKAMLMLMGIAVVFALAGLGCSSTTASGSSGQKLTMLRPADQTLKRGDTNEVAITLLRRDFNSDASVRFANLPSGVKVIEKDRTIQEDDFIVNYTLFAENDADLVSGHVVNVTVEGPDGLAVTESFELTVTE